jgi:ubiquinone/menaquinone biosynthesis C-methylase UbiE
MANTPSTDRFDADAFKDIVRYYNQTRFDYDVAWLNKDNLAVHFGFYDRNHTRHEEALYNTNRTLANISNIRQGCKVLDAGCGRGGSALWLAAERQAEVAGISPVESQILEARQQAEKRGLHSSVKFIVGDYCQTPFPDASFDVVWACESLCHARQKSCFYQEAYRLLRPGGQLIIAEYIRSERTCSDKQEKRLMRWLNRWAIPDIDTAEEHRAHALGAGFSSFSLNDYTRYTWISLKNLYKIASRWLWADYLLYALGIRSRSQHHNILGSRMQYQALKEGLWYYGVIWAQKTAKHG